MYACMYACMYVHTVSILRLVAPEDIRAASSSASSRHGKFHQPHNFQKLLNSTQSCLVDGRDFETIGGCHPSEIPLFFRSSGMQQPRSTAPFIGV